MFSGTGILTHKEEEKYIFTYFKNRDDVHRIDHIESRMIQVESLLKNEKQQLLSRAFYSLF